ncbi:MAG: hypothetical protein WCQ65_09950 [Fermentimonas sp.]
MIVLKKIASQQESNIDFVDSLSGTKDNNNKTFTTPRAYKPGKINIILNGQFLDSDDFEETGDNEITLIWISPKSWDKLGAIYEIKE